MHDSGSESLQPEPHRNDDTPIVFREALSYLHQRALATENMDIPTPILDAGSEPITAVQAEILESQVKDLRSKVLLEGAGIPRGRDEEQLIWAIREGPLEVFSSDPNHLESGHRVFWVIDHGKNGNPDTYFNFYVGKSEHEFDLTVHFGSEQSPYESGKRKMSKMEKHEYAVASHILNSVHKKLLPEEHK